MSNIVLVYGGKSCEHDISIITACLARGYFADYNLYGVYLDKNNVAYLVPDNCTPAQHVCAKFKQKAVFLAGEHAIGVLKHNRITSKITVDAVVNCCHGAHGEDGTVAALCGLMNVPLIGSAITSSAVAMDKILTKRVLDSLGIPTVRGFEINKRNQKKLSQLAEGYRYPLIVKPNTLGSSIGVKVCRDFGELKQNAAAALTYDDRALCEEALADFCELNCAAMRTGGAVCASRVDTPATEHDILTFADKYIDGETADVAKPDVSDEIKGQAQEITKRIYMTLDFSGVIRVDYLYDNLEQKLYVNEINSIPGSLAYGLWNDKYTMTQYGNLLAEQAIKDYNERSKLVTVFSSSVLTLGNVKKK